MEINKQHKCSACGKELFASVSTDIELTEISLVGRCPFCSSSIVLTFVAIPDSTKPKEEKIEPLSIDESLVEDQVEPSVIGDILDEDQI
ncbi:MAG: hypothetical protein QW035_02815 [Candidatus Anstonellales archaeon]